MAKESVTTIDKELYEGLQQARKKKPRNYVLFAKGVEVVGLIVQKKAINEGAVQKAKADCKGSLIVRGTCSGEGVDLKFEVVGEEPSITPKKIKDFIAERTELALKPYWAVVTQLSAVVDDETAPPKTAETSEPTPLSAPTTDTVTYTKIRLAWDGTRKKIQQELQALEKSILEMCNKHNTDEEREYDVDLGEVQTKLKQLYTMLDTLDTRLIDKLDEALNAADPQQRQALQQQAKAIVAEYQAFVETDSMVVNIDSNGFLTTKIRPTLTGVLSTLAAKL